MIILLVSIFSKKYYKTVFEYDYTNFESTNTITIYVGEILDILQLKIMYRRKIL